MFNDWQAILGMIGFVALIWGFIWFSNKAYRWRAINRMERLRAEEYEEELIPISPDYSAIRMRSKGESVIPQPVLHEQEMECKALKLPQVGDEIPFVALRGKGQRRLRQAEVESVQPAHNSFVLRWQDTNNRWHRRRMTPSMIRRRQVLTAW
ncbi:hypothetical protein KKC63_00605 [Patescibacteria group bacterium]|nr:hypothetical protein [Patescibacteria group bacterium]